MLSDQIHRALAQGHNRFEVCRMTAKGVKAMHRSGGRFEDTIGLALTGIGNGESGKPEASENISAKS